MSKSDAVHGLMQDSNRRTPEFLHDASDTGLAKAVMRLAMELSVLRDRLDVVEALGEQHGFASAEAIDNYQPDETLQATRAARRTRLIQQITKDLS